MLTVFFISLSFFLVQGLLCQFIGFSSLAGSGCVIKFGLLSFYRSEGSFDFFFYGPNLVLLGCSFFLFCVCSLIYKTLFWRSA